MAEEAEVPDHLKAHVFLSCGQRDGELEAAKELGRILHRRGYATYIARQQASLEGVREAIFPQLRDADYLLFVDFPRDAIGEDHCRGSLFSHQELAIASFLDIPYIGFRHRSVRREGLSDFLLSNAAEFNEAIELPQMLREELDKRSVDWNPRSRKRLFITRPDPDERSDMVVNGRPGRFFHLTVKNLHQGKMAVNCTAYVETIIDSETLRPILFKSAELKWAGTTIPWVAIMGGRARDLDACLIFEQDPRTIHFVSLSDSGEYMAPIRGRNVDITYLVLSENFPVARCTLRIELGLTAQTARVYEVTADP